MSLETDLNNLKKKWKKNGYYESNLFYNIIDIVINLVFIFSSTKIKNGFISGILMGTGYHQFGRLGHELGHRSGIFNVRRIHSEDIYNKCLLLINLFLGIDGFLWKSEHRQHHEHTMHNSDCQIASDYPPLFTNNKDVYNKKIKYGNLLERILLKQQHNLGIFLVALVGKINISLLNLKNINDNDILLRKSAIFLHYIPIFLMCLNRLNKYGIRNSIEYMFMANFVYGILHIQLIFNHITEPHHNNSTKNDIRQQIISTRNYKCNPYGFWHWFHLPASAHQIEHHIDPKISSEHLHKITEDVQKLCKDHNIEYKSEDFLEILLKYRESLKKL